jgi:hypothetical protein
MRAMNLQWSVALPSTETVATILRYELRSFININFVCVDECIELMQVYGRV